MHFLSHEVYAKLLSSEELVVFVFTHACQLTVFFYPAQCWLRTKSLYDLYSQVSVTTLTCTMIRAKWTHTVLIVLLVVTNPIDWFAYTHIHTHNTGPGEG